ncbi:MAG: hypothetical protein Kow0037_29760 [Calditrichia bacterium]
MNILLLISGAIAAFVIIGHFIFGIRWYLQPMLDAEFEAIPKRVMHAVFHYVSVFLILSTLALLGAALGLLPGASSLLVKFIGLNYFLFAIWQILLAATSGIPGALIKMFQWSAFLPIAVLAWLGA